MSEKKLNHDKFKFYIKRIYSKDISFEVPHAPQIFQQEWKKPQVKINLVNSSFQLNKKTYEVVLSINVTVSLDQKIAFLCEIKQAGIFDLNEIDFNNIDYCLGVYCPDVLFTYARECITNLVTRGTFPQFILETVDFNELFINYRKQQK